MEKRIIMTPSLWMMIGSIGVIALFLLNVTGVVADDTVTPTVENESAITEATTTGATPVPNLPADNVTASSSLDTPLADSVSTTTDYSLATSSQTISEDTVLDEDIFDIATDDFYDATLFEEATTSQATTTRMHLSCTMAYTADLYDTPSGHLDTGYVLDSEATPATKKNRIAHRIGTQSWTVCRNAQGKTFEFKITPSEYSEVSQQDTPFTEREI